MRFKTRSDGTKRLILFEKNKDTFECGFYMYWSSSKNSNLPSVQNVSSLYKKRNNSNNEEIYEDGTK